jgi:hypothetical protein
MFRLLMWSSSGRCVTQNKYIEMSQAEILGYGKGKR